MNNYKLIKLANICDLYNACRYLLRVKQADLATIVPDTVNIGPPVNSIVDNMRPNDTQPKVVGQSITPGFLSADAIINNKSIKEGPEYLSPHIFNRNTTVEPKNKWFYRYSSGGGRSTNFKSNLYQDIGALLMPNKGLPNGMKVNPASRLHGVIGLSGGLLGRAGLGLGVGGIGSAIGHGIARSLGAKEGDFWDNAAGYAGFGIGSTVGSTLGYGIGSRLGKFGHKYFTGGKGFNNYGVPTPYINK